MNKSATRGIVVDFDGSGEYYCKGFIDITKAMKSEIACVNPYMKTYMQSI